MRLEFSSLVGHQPWFFVPDTGTPGGTGVLTAPDGTTATCVNTQLDSKVWPWPSLGDSFTAPRLGFECPGVFHTPGVYTLTVTQDTDTAGTVVDEYTITVVYDLVALVDQGNLGEAGRLNQLRGLLGRKPFDFTETATADGYTADEVAALNQFRTTRGWQPLTQEA
jgi:hypothetical protein